MVKVRQNRGEKTKSQPFSHNTSYNAKFSHNTPLMRKCFCGNFQKNMLSVPSQIPYANFTGMRTICQPYANSFLRQKLKNHALCLGSHRNAKFSHSLKSICEIRISFLKSCSPLPMLNSFFISHSTSLPITKSLP